MSINWQHSYIPLSVLRQPFLIGQQQIREHGRGADATGAAS